MDIPPSIIHSGKLIQSLSLFSELSLCFPFLDYNFTYNAFEIYHKFKMQNLRLRSRCHFLPRTQTSLSFMSVSNQREEIYKAANLDVGRMSDLPSDDFYKFIIACSTVLKKKEKNNSSAMFYLYY